MTMLEYDFRTLPLKEQFWYGYECAFWEHQFLRGWITQKRIVPEYRHQTDEFLKGYDSYFETQTKVIRKKPGD